MANWKPLNFPKIKRHSTYSLIKHLDQNTISALKTESQNSASGILHISKFRLRESPIIRWRWRVENIYRKGNGKVKDGDDYPLRIYILFEHAKKEETFWNRLRKKSAKLLYGQSPPDSSLNYIWANKKHSSNIFSSPYTERAKMLVVDHGTEHLNTWRVHERNIIEDYKNAFGSEAPSTASLAIMNDSDNTGEASISYLDYIELFQHLPSSNIRQK